MIQGKAISEFNKGPLYTRSQAPKKLGANFEHFWVANWPQVSQKAMIGL
jgi:hypothetical protein